MALDGDAAPLTPSLGFCQCTVVLTQSSALSTKSTGSRCGKSLDDVLEEFGGYVSSETLSESLERVGSLSAKLPLKEIKLGKEKVEFAVEKVR